MIWPIVAVWIVLFGVVANLLILRWWVEDLHEWIDDLRRRDESLCQREEEAHRG